MSSSGEQYRPCRLEVLLFGESLPDLGLAGAGSLCPTLQIDNLYRAVAQGLYSDRPGLIWPTSRPCCGDSRPMGSGSSRRSTSRSKPISHQSRGGAAITAAVPQLVTRSCELAPRHEVVICHLGGLPAAPPQPGRRRVDVLYDRRLPFALGNWRAEFVAGLRRALT
jgi:hypothetical protein